MATKVVMEALSPTMEEGRLVEWKKGEGEAVAVGDVLAEVETDKAVMELVARAGGTLLKQVVPAGTTVPVSQLVALIGDPGEQVGEGNGRDGGAKAKPAAPAESATPPAPAPSPLPPGTTSRRKGLRAPAGHQRKVSGSRPRRSHAGSRPNGGSTWARCTGPGRRDAWSCATSRVPEPSPRRPRGAPRPVVRTGGGPAYTDVPLTQIRKTIAKRLVQSIGPVPTFYLTTDVDMERVWDAREALKGLGDGPKVSFNDIIIKAVAAALRHTPCNAWWQDDHIRYWNEVHVSIAVAVEEGLITPVIRHADLKTLREIAAESHDLAGESARAAAQTRGVHRRNLLGLESRHARHPRVHRDHQSARGGHPGRRPDRSDAGGAGGTGRASAADALTMSCDHRVIDGATGAQFLQTLKAMLENPLAMVC